jgi:hypothetical protein
VDTSAILFSEKKPEKDILNVVSLELLVNLADSKPAFTANNESLLFKMWSLEMLLGETKPMVDIDG